MIGPAIGSLATNLGHAAPGLIAAALCALNVAFAWHWLPETAPARHEPADPSARRPVRPPARRSVRKSMWEVVRHPAAPVSQLIWIYAIGMLGFMSMTGVLALYLERAFGVTEKTIGLIFVYTGALGVVMRALILGRLTDALGEKRVMRLGACSLATGLLFAPLPHSVWTLAPVIGLVPIGTAMLFPATTALTTHLAADAERGQILGVAQTFGGLSRVIGPIWATAAFQTLGIGVPFYVAAGIVVVVIALAFQVKGGGDEVLATG
jgi:predicted MFS family arabinose efflux permease